VRFVRDAPLGLEAEAKIKRDIADTLGGGVTVSLERVNEIARTNRGKFMAALCEIAPREVGQGDS